MIKSDCKAQQGDHTVERTKIRTEAAGTKEGEGGAESSGLGANPALTKVPCGCMPCVQPTFTPCGVRRSESSILTLRIMLRVKINVSIHIEHRNGVKIFKKSVFGMRIFTQKLTRPPFGVKKKYSEM